MAENRYGQPDHGIHIRHGFAVETVIAPIFLEVAHDIADSERPLPDSLECVGQKGARLTPHRLGNGKVALAPEVFFHDRGDIIPRLFDDPGIHEQEVVGIVDFVGNAADHRSQRGHPVDLDQPGLNLQGLFLQPDTVCNVAEGHVYDLGALQENLLAVERQGANLSRRKKAFEIFDLAGIIILDDLINCRFKVIIAFLVTQCRQPSRHQLRPSFPEDTLRGGVYVDDRVVTWRDQDDGILAMLEQLPEAFFTFVQGRSGHESLFVVFLEVDIRRVEFSGTFLDPLFEMLLVVFQLGRFKFIVINQYYERFEQIVIQHHKEGNYQSQCVKQGLLPPRGGSIIECGHDYDLDGKYAQDQDEYQPQRRKDERSVAITHQHFRFF